MMSDDYKDRHRYDDIIGLPHHVSLVHRRMGREERAAQFSPFAALTGFESVIEETGRWTEEKRELDEDAKGILDEKLRQIEEEKGQRMVGITYFRGDERKDGGEYVTVTGCVKRIDRYEGIVIMRDGERIPMDDIVGVEEL